ncbi:50S ribosomal protein L6 ['Opuntia sp.' phytoplasma]|uniref:50S ribosomal protein L6 n=1 Tax=Candidatus Phytoplasma asiaticum TaxID=2763338 RepID=A0AAX3B9K8_9MOLU|nr:MULTISPECIES: 50S ribosomal protein L6 [Phytoplasma]MDO8053938.1 50S ribosomal protein L6 ['Opuntia sp.' phytoplasma]MDO8057683.1 50S ribosomal protein L6 ['Opuntia sp.' phytoplasma]UQV27372.1 50S ribosomal protein L6 ['Parthenium hysterophorus' phyllody phytoplasma]
MSRVGRKIISIPEGVVVEIKPDNQVLVSSSQGKLEFQFNSCLSIIKKNNIITITRPNNNNFMKKIHGTTRALLNNMVQGVKNLFSKELKITGLGYSCTVEEDKLVFKLGYSHDIIMNILPNLIVQVNKQNNLIIIKGVDKQLVGEFAAKIISLAKPEPYKGTGIYYVGGYIHRKAGKSAKK